MANWLDGAEMSNVWGSFKTKLASTLTTLSNSISQNAADISERITKKQYGIQNAFRYKNTDIFNDTNSDIYKYLYSNYAYPYSNSYPNKYNYRKTITQEGRIFEYDCANQYVIEINPINGNITKYSMKTNNSSITYQWYIGTYVDGDDIYSYLWGIGGSGYGIFKVKHGDASYASSISSLYIYDIAQDSNYYVVSGTTPVYSTSTSYFRVSLSVLVGDKVCVICNPRTNYSSYYSEYNIQFVWDGSTRKQLSVSLPTGFYNGQYYFYQRGINIATVGNTTYTGGYKFSLYSNSSSKATFKVTKVIPDNSSDEYIYPCGFYDDYVVFGYMQSNNYNTLMFLPINDSSYYEIVPFKESYENGNAYYNRLIFTHIDDDNGGKNYMFMPVFYYIDGYTGTGVVLKNLDE